MLRKNFMGMVYNEMCDTATRTKAIFFGEMETEQAGQEEETPNIVVDGGVGKYDGADTVKERESDDLSWGLVVVKYCHSL